MDRNYKVKSLRNKIILQYVLIVFITLSFLQGIFCIFMHSYYYDGIEKTIADHIKASSNLLERYYSNYYFSNKNILVFIRDNFEYDSFELQILDNDNQIISSTTGFTSKEKILTPEIEQAKKSHQLEKWVGINESTGEKVMALSYPLKYKTKSSYTLRYVVSMSEIDMILRRIYTNTILLSSGILIIVFGISLALTNSIFIPIKAVISASNKMARGNFDIKLQEDYEGEVGELARTINYMAQEIQKTEKLQNEFISSVSHELRTPLTSIKGWSETMLIGDQLNEEEAKFAFSIISKESDRLIGLVEELLDFSRFQSNQITLLKEKHYCKDILHGVVSQLQQKAKTRGITITYTADANPLVSIDENRIKQVLINIIHNAIKYSPENSLITLSTKETKEQFFIIIKDNGIGISDKDLKKVKQLFYQIDAKKDGLGVGLAISQQIMDLHGGKLLINSKLGQGTTITLILPK